MPISIFSRFAILLCILFPFILAGCTQQQTGSDKSVISPATNINQIVNLHLLDQVQLEYGQTNQPYTLELQRRIKRKRMSPYHLSRAVEQCITLRRLNPQWDDLLWQEILYDLLEQKAFSDNQLKKIITDSYLATATMDPMIRMGNSFGCLTSNTFTPLGKNVEFDITTLFDRWYINDHLWREIDYVSQYKAYATSNGTHINRGMNGGTDALPRYFNEAHPTSARITYRAQSTFRLVKPATYPPMTFEAVVRRQTPVLSERNEQTNLKIAVESPHLKSEDWVQTRVFTLRKSIFVWVRFENITQPQIFEIWMWDQQQKIRMGTFQVLPTMNGRWCQFRKNLRSIGRSDQFAKSVSIELLPMSITDAKTKPASIFAHLPIIRENIPVNGPYTPAFNMDRSLASAVQQAVSIEKVKREKKNFLEIGFDINAAPVRLGYHVITDEHTEREREYPRCLSVLKGKKVWAGHSSQLDSDQQTINIMLMPDQNWELRSMLNWEILTDSITPPWGYPILFENIPIPKAGEPGKVKIYGKILMPQNNNE